MLIPITGGVWEIKKKQQQSQAQKGDGSTNSNEGKHEIQPAATRQQRPDHPGARDTRV